MNTRGLENFPKHNSIQTRKYLSPLPGIWFFTRDTKVPDFKFLTIKVFFTRKTEHINIFELFLFKRKFGYLPE